MLAGRHRYTVPNLVFAGQDKALSEQDRFAACPSPRAPQLEEQERKKLVAIMAFAPRAFSMLPTIKCSSCGVEIEISMMGEHTCSQGMPFS